MKINLIYLGILLSAIASLCLTGCTPDEEETIKAPDPLTFQFTSTSNSESIKIKTVPSSEEVSYFLSILTPEEMKEVGSSDEELTDYAFRKYLRGEINENELLTGEKESTFDDLHLNTEYAFVAIGVYEGQMHGTGITRATTKEWKEDGFSLHLRPEVIEIGLDYIDVKVDTDKDDIYYVALPYNYLEIPLNAPAEYVFVQIVKDIQNTCRNLRCSVKEFLQKAEGTLSFKGSKKISVNRLNNFFDYGLYIVGIDNDLKQVSAFHKIVFKTKKAPVDEIKFDIKSTIEGRKVTLDIKPDDKNALWSYMIVESSRWKSMTTIESKEWVIQNILQNRYAMLRNTNPDLTHEEKVKTITHIGDFIHKAEEKYANEEYTYVMAKFIAGRSNIYVSSLATVGTYKTEKAEQADTKFYFEVSNIGIKDVTVKVSPSNKETPYTFAAVPFWKWKESTDEEIMNAYIGSNRGQLNSGRAIVKGEQIKTLSIVPDTEYALIAFGYAEGGTSTPLSMTKFNSAKSGDVTATQFDLRIDKVNQKDITYSVLPSDTTVYWQANIVPASQYDADKIRSRAEQTIANRLKWARGLNYCMVNAVDETSKMGKMENVLKRSLLPSTEYVLYLIPVKTDGTCLTPISKKFTTKAFCTSKATVTGKIGNHYDAGKVDFIPEAGSFCRPGRILFPVELTFSEDADQMFYVMQMNSNIENWDDEKILTNMFIRIKPLQDVLYLTAGVNEPFTLIVGVKDKNGEFGHLYKKYMKLSLDTVSPIEELKEFYNKHKK